MCLLVLVRLLVEVGSSSQIDSLTGLSVPIHPVFWWNGSKWIQKEETSNGKNRDMITNGVDLQLKDFMKWNEYPNKLTVYRSALDTENQTG